MTADTLILTAAIVVASVVGLVGLSMWAAHVAAVRDAERDPLTANYVQAVLGRDVIRARSCLATLTARYGSVVAEQAAARVRARMLEVLP